MKLFTKEIENALKKYGYCSQDGKGLEAKVIARFFGGSSCTWYILEGTEEHDILYGLASIGYGFEYGYISRNELENLKFPPLNLPVERDKSIKPLKYTLGECMKRYKERMINEDMTVGDLFPMEWRRRENEI